MSPAHDRYPTPGRLEGTTSFFRAADAPKRVNAGYPAWFRGEDSGGLADEQSQYHYTQILGPAGSVITGLHADNLRFGTLELKPGAVYPAHNHPAAEVYYVVEGEAEWWVDDEVQHVSAGWTIYHRPYAVHGWRNTSATVPLKLVWVWWAEGDATPADLDRPARLVNPELAADPRTARPFAVPLPSVRPR